MILNKRFSIIQSKNELEIWDNQNKNVMVSYRKFKNLLYNNHLLIMNDNKGIIILQVEKNFVKCIFNYEVDNNRSFIDIIFNNNILNITDLSNGKILNYQYNGNEFL